VADAVIRTREIIKVYNGRAVVNGVSMTLARGEIYGFVGNNGAGKTTLIRMLTGLAQPTSGTMELFGGGDARSIAAARKKMGSVIDSPAVYKNMSAEENLKMRAYTLGIKPDFAEVLGTVGLGGVGNKLASNFSMGMKQRLGIAMALLGNPELLILDEPINGLDPEGIVEFREFLKYINRTRGITILISSHVLGELHKVATAYGIIRDGILVAEFPKSALDAFIRPYIRIAVDNPVAARNALTDGGINRTDILHNNVIRVFERIDDIPFLVQTLKAAGVLTLSIESVTDDSEAFLVSLMGGIRY
jgi:ABC-2 type transport system ATP-binding protein